MIVDTFLFSEAHETEILLAKLHVESEIIDHWIAVENAWTTKGDQKSAELGDILSDKRFSKFSDRLTVISLNERFADNYSPALSDRARKIARRSLAPLRESSRAKYAAHVERPFFYAERMQRSAAFDALMEISRGKGWVLVSDVDEMLDGSDPKRRSIIWDAAQDDRAAIQFQRRRFVYDFSNLAMGKVRTIPMINLKTINSPGDLGHGRTSKYRGSLSSPETVAFEYSYCSGREALVRKLDTFAHVGRDREIVDRALLCNHELRIPTDEPSIDFWHETVDPELAAHPLYIEEHYDQLSTGVVASDYRAQRRLHYPQWFRPFGLSI